MKKLKISIGSKLIDGPWGGGNLFISNLVNYLKQKDVDLFSDLSDNQLDIILLTEPRFNSPTSTISTNEAKYYNIMKTVFVIGSGAREHAIIDTLIRTSDIAKIYINPGNDGMLLLNKIVEISPIDIMIKQILLNFVN